MPGCVCSFACHGRQQKILWPDEFKEGRDGPGPFGPRPADPLGTEFFPGNAIPSKGEKVLSMNRFQSIEDLDAYREEILQRKAPKEIALRCAASWLGYRGSSPSGLC